MAKFGAKLRRRQLDGSLLPYRELPKLPRGYIREIRDALEMSSYQLAARIGITQSSVIEMEENERTGKISLKTLERAAAALGCRLIYGLVPNDSLEEQVLLQARSRANDIVSPVARTMALEQQATDAGVQEDLIKELAEEILRKGGRELWKGHYG